MKKQISILMSLLMILTMLPVSAFAAENDKVSIIGGVQSYTTADTNKEVRLRINMGTFQDLKKGRVTFELDNAVLANTAGPATATIYQGTNTITSPAVAFQSTSGSALTGGERFFNLEIANDVMANNKDNIEIIVSLKMDFSKSSVGDVDLVLRDIGSGGTKTGIGDYDSSVATDQAAPAKDMTVKVNNPATKIGPAGGALSSIVIYELQKLSATTADNKLVVSLPSGFLFAPVTKVTTDGTAPTVAYSTDKRDMTITNISKSTAYINIEPMVILQARDSAKPGNITAGFDLKVNNTTVSSKDTKIGELVEYGLTLTAVEKGQRDIPTLSKGMPKTVEITVKAVDGTLTNGAVINFDLAGANMVFGSLKVTEPTGTILTAPRSAGTSADRKVAGYEVYADNSFSIRTNKYDVQTIKITADLVAEPIAKGPVNLTATSSRVEDQKIEIAKIGQSLTLEVTPNRVDKGVITAVPNIVIKETAVNTVQKGDKIYLELVYPGSDRDKGTSTAFNSAKNIKVATTNGLKIESVVLGAQENIIVLTVDSRSYDGPGTITLTGVKAFLTEKAVMGQVELKMNLNNATLAQSPYFIIGQDLALRTIFKINDKNYTMNGQPKVLVTAPYINNGRTMLPVRAVGDSLGLQASWNNTTKTATFSNEGRTAIVRIGQSTITVNGTPVPLSAPAEIKGGSTMIELRSLATAFGVNIGWDNATKTVTVN